MRGLAFATAFAVLALPASAARAEPANAASSFAAISADGRYVAFDSNASNLVAGDNNGQSDIFVRDRLTSETERVSIGPQGVEGNGLSYVPAISADGRYIAFASFASNLVPGDTNDHADVFVHDRATGTTDVVSAGLGGSPGNDESTRPSISADGRYVAFQSAASNLVPGNGGRTWGVFVRDRADGTTDRVDVSNSGALPTVSHRIYTNAMISADGRFVAFSSEAPNLVDGDTNGTADVFVRDLAAGTTERASVGANGEQLDADNSLYGTAISADGRYVTFMSLGHVFIRDRTGETTERVDVASDGAEANGQACCGQAISGNGRYIAFGSAATNLVPGDRNNAIDVFLRDRLAGTTERVSVGESGEAFGPSRVEVEGMSADGALIAFVSDGSNLIPDTDKTLSNIFVRDRSVARTELISVAPEPQPYIDWTWRSPRPPRAGKILNAIMHVSAASHSVSQATVTARATVRGRRLPVVLKSFGNSEARVVWRIPKSAKNRYLTASITVRTAGGGVTGTFIAIVR